MGKMRNLCDFDGGMVLGGRHGGWSISETAGFLNEANANVSRQECKKTPKKTP